MGKDLPKMYQNRIDKPICNIQKVYNSMNCNDDIILNKGHQFSNQSINKKIDDIFNSYDYVYKADVVIVTDNDVLHKRIVARDNSNLITIDNEFIPIAIIRDIYK